MGASWVILVVLFPVFLLLVYPATKARGRTVSVALGTFVALALAWGILSQFRAPPSDWAYPIGTVLSDGTSMEEPAISNQELWNQLTKSRIELVEEKPANKNRDKEEEQDSTASAPAKPDWVDHPPKRIGNVTRRVVASGPFSTVEECYAQLEALLQGAVRERVQTLLANRARLSMLAIDLDSFGVDSFDIGLKYIVREICQDEFTETVSASFGEMKRVHVLLEFNPAVDGYLLAEWQKTERRHRLGVVGQFAAAVLSLLLLVYGLLKFDSWTQGHYTKRLLVGLPAVIIAVAVLFLS